MGLVPEGEEVGEDMSLRISLRRASTMEVLNNGLDSSVIDTNNFWSKIERGVGGE